ncbi:WD and tetratricopeptide repeats protein 1 [Belonocnema kinseyi]|uniref:WD and tetratricopeptide repeats protein 1 n=1 Tax=Belonocnema kinseyi TaxID=2817044 RepID=UPI00143DF631|nr:WD and tetratricopeptide repeats protein 1 [Belonocnema kinseyi]XP_033227506.1 WD and tetratricopeptide repeats protein 1 [Belonocnema kinseyi]XP_033227507.1 WD and tetratricopeptide repeats protein 1 [Belonocnema kinseyi]
MDMIPNIRNEKKHRVIDLLRQREIQESAAYLTSQKLHVTENFIARLGLETELKGHGGCVNCLEWNETGQTLASASDDMHIILWDPFRYEKKLVLHTGHNGNIFSVKFLPKSNDSVLISGAGDSRIRVHDLTLSDTILACNCHTGRVKRIATAPNIPYLFWSAAEDGIIMQFDMRAPHTCKVAQENNVLINLVNHVGRTIEAKCISVNTRRPELIAVGANDPYIRLYDRRMIKLSSRPIIEPALPPPTQTWVRADHSERQLEEGDPELNNVPLGCVQYFIAGHLHSRQRDHTRSLSTTYLTFSNDGNELLVNMGGEQIYLFDINERRKAKSFIAPLDSISDSNDKDQDYENYFLDSSEDDVQDLSLKNVSELPPQVEELKQQANENFEKEKYSLAINLYNKAISLCHMAAVLYANRAAAYMKRNWDGDTYAALRDCQMTLMLDPEHIKAHFRLARCLNDLNRPTEAYHVIEKFQKKFPEYSNNQSCRALKKDIKEAINSGKEAVQSPTQLSLFEKKWRMNAKDYKQRFCGHCNTTTDIKEANFFGNNGQYIVAGSDDGSFFIWDQVTTNIVRVLRGDERIVNCLQPHPSTCLLATSGIDPVIRLWSPLPEDGEANEREIQNPDDAASANQIRMNSDPFELMLMNMGYRFPGQNSSLGDDGDGEGLPTTRPPIDSCRPS